MVDPKVCVQFKLKNNNASKALSEAGITSEDVTKLKIKDYKFEAIDPDDIESKRQINRFIVENEYLGKPHMRTTHSFVARYKGHLAGVVTLSTPNAFSHLLGAEFKDKEKLISRGATSALACKNLGSALNAFAIDWMVKNTEFRFFTAYSDPEANELGSIYKALNFIYLGSNFGAKLLLSDPDRPDKGWFSDREARKLSNVKRLARKKGIKWKKHYNTGWTINWHLMEPLEELVIRSAVKAYINGFCFRRRPSRKHKWVYIRGKDRKEHKQLLKTFKMKNPKLIQSDGRLGLPYPTENSRGQHA